MEIQLTINNYDGFDIELFKIDINNFSEITDITRNKNEVII